MKEGLILITAGLVVVMVILVIMAVLVEIIMFYDGYMRARQKARREAEEAHDDSLVPAEVIVAIGLALHQHFQGQVAAVGISPVERRRATIWTSSGRLEMMSARQKVSDRLK